MPGAGPEDPVIRQLPLRIEGIGMRAEIRKHVGWLIARIIHLLKGRRPEVEDDGHRNQGRRRDSPAPAPQKDHQRLGGRSDREGEKENGEQQVAAGGQHLHHGKSLEGGKQIPEDQEGRQPETTEAGQKTEDQLPGATAQGGRNTAGNEDCQRQSEVAAVPVDLDIGRREHPEAVVRPGQHVLPRRDRHRREVHHALVEPRVVALKRHRQDQVPPEDQAAGEKQPRPPDQAAPASVRTDRYRQAQSRVHPQQDGSPEGVPRVGQGQRSQADPAGQAVGQSFPIRGQTGARQTLEEVEGQGQQGVEERQRKAAHDDDLLGVPEAQHVGQAGDEAGSPRAGQGARQQVHRHSGSGVAAPPSPLSATGTHPSRAGRPAL